MRVFLLTIVVLVSMFSQVCGQQRNFDSFDREKWRDLTEDIDYSESEEAKPEKKKNNKADGERSRSSGGGSIFPVGGQVFQIVIIAVFIVILIIVISKLVGNNLRLRHKGDSGNTEQTLEELEENLMESDLMKWLKKVVEEKNYRLALRIYYLIIIKELASNGLINWKKEKTNMDYLYEMRGHNSYNQFEEVTGIYQLIWYGEKDLGDKYLLEMSHKFRQYFQSIKTPANG